MSDVIGRYTLLQKLAHGGMAEIFLGVPSSGSDNVSRVVIKRILPELARDERFLAMFLNEAQLASQMRHENIVRVFEFGEDNGLLYMVMEYVDGLDCWRLSKKLEDWGENHVGVAVHIVRKVLDALEYAHNMKDVNGKRLNVVHRDLSPSNIYISKKGDVKLGDFGIARVESSRFRPIEIIPKGKFGYMAPEQVEGQPVDRRADVYSAGVVLSELLIQQQLFTGSSQLSVMLDIRDGRIDKLEKNAERIPADLLDLIKIALARNPSERFRTAADFSIALRAYQNDMVVPIGANALAQKVTEAIDIIQATGPSSEMNAMAANLGGNQVVAAIQRTRPDGVTNAMSIAPVNAEDGTPITLELEHYQNTGQFWARLPGGQAVGPTSFAHIVELIYSDKIGATTPVSTDGRDFQPAREFEELLRHLPGAESSQSDNKLTHPKRRGLLEIESPIQILLAMAASRDTGLLVCQFGGRRKEVYVRSGVSVYVGSNESSELLGEYLVDNKVIDRMELDMALALLPKFHGHLGDTLIALGMLTAVELFTHIGNQVRARLSDLAGWRNGQYEFYEGVGVRGGILEVPTDLFSFVRDALLSQVQSIDGTEVIERLEEYRVARAGIFSSVIDLLSLPSELGDRIRSIDDWMSVSDLTHSSSAVPLFLGKAIFVAIEAGLWSYEGPTPYWRE